jgi:hypothetical protein
MLTSFCDMTLCTLADRFQHSSGSTGNCPYTSCCIFSKQIPSDFQAHWYQDLQFPSSYFVCPLPSLYTSSHIYLLSLFSTHKTAISFQQFPCSLSWSTTRNTMYHFFITRFNILPWRWQQHLLPKHWYLSTTLHSVTSQNTICNLNIFCHENLKFYILTYATQYIKLQETAN